MAGDRARLRLVFIAPFARAPKSTTSARVTPLARALAGRGHRVTVLIPPYDNLSESGQVSEEGGVRIEALAIKERVPEQSLRQAWLQPRLAQALVQRAWSLNPDAIHIFKPKAVSGLSQLLSWYGSALPGALASRLGRSATPPALVLDTDDWEGFGGWNDYEHYRWWQKQLCDWQERWGLRHAHAITVASRTLETQAWSHGVPPERTVYLPNGLDLEAYRHWRDADGHEARAALGLAGVPVLVLYTRFFEFQPQRIVQIMVRVRAQVPEAKLLVVGAGKFGQERTLEQLARAAGIGEAIVIAGWQSPERLPALLAAGDVALSPCEDNLANRAKCSVRLLQLLWLGKPVVADRVGQQAEYVEHGVSGLLSDPSDPASMAAAAVRLLRDRDLATRLAAGGQRRVEQEFTWSCLAPRAERAYHVALGCARRPPATLRLSGAAALTRQRHSG